MSFNIDDDPETPQSIFATMPGWATDTFEGDPEKIAHDYAYHLISEIGRPAKLVTVRKRLQANWAFLNQLSYMHPEIFDEVMTAFVERVYLVEHPNAA